MSRPRPARMRGPRTDRRAVLSGIASLGAVGALGADQASAEQAPRIDVALARGVNLSHWFAQSLSGYEPADVKRYVTQGDLGRLRGCGLTHVRIPVDPDVLFERGADAFVEPLIAVLRGAVAEAAAQRLAVVVDVHPVSHAIKQAMSSSAGEALFLARLSRLAAALADARSGEMFLEILNEPEPLKGEDWWRLQGRALAAVRAAAGPKLPVIANGGGWSDIDDLDPRSPYDDPNVVYSVHFYAPLLFTHQATTWSWDVAKQVEGIGWPLTPDDAAPASAAAAKGERARGFLSDQITAGAFTAAAIDRKFAKLDAWSQRHGGKPIYVGEFGVYAKRAPEAARLAWVSHVRRACEGRGWGWALWDYSPSFGLLTDGQQTRRLEGDMLASLGLTVR